MVGILAVGNDSREVTLRLVVVASHKCHISHTQVVSVALLGREHIVIDLAKLLLGHSIVAKHTVVVAQFVLHIVGKRRAAILGQKTSQARLGTLHLEFILAACKVVIHTLDLLPILHRREPLSKAQKLLPSLDPMAIVAERHGTLQGIVRDLSLGLRRRQTQRENEQRK